MFPIILDYLNICNYYFLQRCVCVGYELFMRIRNITTVNAIITTDVYVSVCHFLCELNYTKSHEDVWFYQFRTPKIV